MPPSIGRRTFAAWQQRQLEEGHDAAAQEDGWIASKLPNLDDAEKKQQNRSKAWLTILLLLGFLSFCIFALSAAALSCRMLDMQRNFSSDVDFVGDKNSTSCYFEARPISDFWSSRYWIIMLVNSASTLVMLQSLILVFQPPRRDPASGNPMLHPALMLDTETLESCPTHPQDFILRLIYKTSCRDDVIIKTLPPMRSVGGLSSTMKQTKTQELLHSQARTNQLRQAAQANQEAYQIRMSLGGQSADDERISDESTIGAMDKKWQFNDWMRRTTADEQR